MSEERSRYRRDDPAACCDVVIAVLVLLHWCSPGKSFADTYPVVDTFPTDAYQVVGQPGQVHQLLVAPTPIGSCEAATVCPSQERSIRLCTI